MACKQNAVALSARHRSGKEFHHGLSRSTFDEHSLSVPEVAFQFPCNHPVDRHDGEPMCCELGVQTRELFFRKALEAAPFPELGGDRLEFFRAKQFRDFWKPSITVVIHKLSAGLFGIEHF